MDEQNNQSPEFGTGFEKTKKKSKKIKVIIITIIVAVLAAVAVFAALVLTGKISFSKKDKMSDGISKAKETFTKPIEDMLKSSSPKITSNMSNANAMEFSTEMSASIDKFEVDGLSSSNEKTIDTIKDVLNGTTLSVNGKSDIKNGKFEGTVNAKVDGLVDNISADVVYNNDTIGVRSKEVNEKYLTVTTDDLEEVASDEVKEVFDSIDEEQLNEIAEKMQSINISDSEIEHFKSVYDGLFIKQIESDMIEKESKKEKIKVDGKEKNCTKYVLKLDADDMKSILNAYIDAFDDDDEGKEIIKNKFNALMEIYNTAAETSSSSSVSNISVDSALDRGVEEIRSSIDEIDFDGDITVTVYADLTNVYAIDFEVEVEGQSVVAKMTFNKNNTKVVVEVLDQEVLVMDIVNEENKKEFKFTSGKDLKDISNVDFELSLLFQKNNNEKTYSISGNMSQGSTEVKGKIESIVTTNKDEDKELDTNSKLNVELSGDVEGNSLDIALGLNMKSNIKLVDSITVTELTPENSINAIKDQTALQQYAQESSANAQKLVEDLSNSKVVKSLIELYEDSNSSYNSLYDDLYDNSYDSSYNNSYDNSYNDLYNDTYNNLYNSTNTYDYNELYNNISY